MLTRSCLVAVGSLGSKILYYLAITAFLLYGGASAWTQEDLELFDVVEEVNENFYTFLGLSPDVDTAAIKKAYRKLSLQYHPDKNKEPGSEEKFRKIVAVVEILKDEEKRKKYDAVLENGLPDWRQPVYYYRRVRKMGIAELSFFLVVLLTLGQHVLAWAAYWERKYELEETVLAKFKRKERKSKKLTPVEDEIRASYLDSLGKPRYHDLLIDGGSDRGAVRKTPWGEEDTVALIRAMKKYPTGTVDRWLKIADLLNRSQDEVMSVMKQLRNSPAANALPHSQGVTGEDYHCLDENATRTDGELSLPPPTRAEKQPRVALPLAQRVADWSQEQQKCMEAALQMYPKGTEDRWDRIAEAVPGKSKEECMLRFKFLVEQLKRRKVEEKSKMS
ncbi:hypothetical protein HPB49_001566 [Dermacentor silvarum]|uniref:Uncharacterized protein n=1 Tax=Dermacentor silvarum TaxID=543639 RepID=A0ACB8CIX1_DERSI|nr:hypothetical protein HPB49_001566 [Dermacentor silvarum]